jgi:hypothetical protein
LVVGSAVFLRWLAVVAAFGFVAICRFCGDMKASIAIYRHSKRKKTENRVRKVCSGPGDQDQWSAWEGMILTAEGMRFISDTLYKNSGQLRS